MTARAGHEVGSGASRPGAETPSRPAFKLVFYVPDTHLEMVKAAVFAAGAGRIGDYDQCCWQVAGQGQFRPLPGSRPFIGQSGQVERVPEHRVEMVLAEAVLPATVAALKAAHPYETPAYDVVCLVDI